MMREREKCKCGEEEERIIVEITVFFLSLSSLNSPGLFTLEVKCQYCEKDLFSLLLSSKRMKMVEKRFDVYFFFFST